MKNISFQKEFPELSHEIIDSLHRQDKRKLAEQVSSLQIVDRCRCGEDFCSMIYFIPPPQGKWQGNLESIGLDSDEGKIILDIVDDQIATAEVLYRDEIRQKLIQILP